MREPNIKEVIESLAADDFSEAIFQKYRNAEAEIAQLMYFLQEKQAPTLYNEIAGLSDDKKNAVIGSLVKLYPMSKSLIFYLLNKREATPKDFLKIYDLDKKLLDNIKGTLEEVKGESSAASVEYNSYLKEIEKESKQIGQLKSTMEQLRRASDELEHKRKEHAELKAELDSLNAELEGNLDIQIQRLKEETKEQREKVEKKKQERRQLKVELQEISENLQHGGALNKEFQTALKGLEECIKAI